MNKNETKQRKFWPWVRRRKWWIILFAIIAGITIYFLTATGGSTSTGFATATITRGDLRQVVTATGEIQPLNTINVGSQVSGTIEAIYVDYNSKVKKGDVLLEIEPSVLQASVDEAYASLVSAESQRNYAKSEYERNKILYSDGFISRAELEQSQTTYEQAEQSVNRMQSQYDRAVTNLGYATITSPVDGTVISRQVTLARRSLHLSRRQTCLKSPKICQKCKLKPPCPKQTSALLKKVKVLRLPLTHIRPRRLRVLCVRCACRRQSHQTLLCTPW